MKLLITSPDVARDRWLPLCLRRAKRHCPFPLPKILQADPETEATMVSSYGGIPVLRVGTRAERETYVRELRNRGIDWPTYEHACLLERGIEMEDVPCLIIHSDTIFLRPVVDFVAAHQGNFAVNSNFILLRNYEHRRNLSFLKKDAAAFPREFGFQANAKTDPFVHLGRRHARFGPEDAGVSLASLLAFYGITREVLLA